MAGGGSPTCRIRFLGLGPKRASHAAVQSSWGPRCWGVPRAFASRPLLARTRAGVARAAVCSPGPSSRRPSCCNRSPRRFSFPLGTCRNRSAPHPHTLPLCLGYWWCFVQRARWHAHSSSLLSRLSSRKGALAFLASAAVCLSSSPELSSRCTVPSGFPRIFSSRSRRFSPFLALPSLVPFAPPSPAAGVGVRHGHPDAVDAVAHASRLGHALRREPPPWQGEHSPPPSSSPPPRHTAAGVW